MKAKAAVLCVIVSVGVGCSSTSYRISPTPPTTVSWENKALTPGELRIHNAKEGRVDRILTRTVGEGVRQEYLKAGQPTTDKTTDIDVYVSDGTRGMWTVATCMCSLFILPVKITTDTAYWGEVKVLDGQGQTIYKCDLPRYSSELATYYSVYSPLGYIGLVGDADIQRAGIQGSEMPFVREKINEPQHVLVRILLGEINKIMLTEPKQTSVPAAPPVADKPKGTIRAQIDTDRKPTN